jgi:hypothetical protein
MTVNLIIYAMSDKLNISWIDETRFQFEQTLTISQLLY